MPTSSSIAPVRLDTPRRRLPVNWQRWDIRTSATMLRGSLTGSKRGYQQRANTSISYSPSAGVGPSLTPFSPGQRGRPSFYASSHAKRDSHVTTTIVVSHTYPTEVAKETSIAGCANRRIQRQLHLHRIRLPKGTHFAAWEQREFFASELRASFKSLR